jgi:hypothetical protein
MPFTIQRFLKVSITAKRVTLGHGNDCSPDLDYAFQALAIDENRITFPPTLWHKTADGPAKDLQQCWFPGVHSNIGGGSGRTPLELGEISHVTFAWMVSPSSLLIYLLAC